MDEDGVTKEDCGRMTRKQARMEQARAPEQPVALLLRTAMITMKGGTDKKKTTAMQ
jgi:hypothetical protein